MFSKSDIQSLAGYIPHNVLTHIGSSGAATRGLVEDRFEAAVFFTDVSGFTEISESLAMRPSGAEDLSLLLNEQFGLIIDAISEHGGYVMDFIGDAIIALWPVSASRDLEKSVECASRCALTLQASMSARRDSDPHQMTTRICISCGEIWTAIIKGVEGKSYWLASGKPIEDARAIESEVSAGEVAATASAWTLLCDRFAGTKLRDDFTIVEKPLDIDYDPEPVHAVSVESFDLIRPYLPPPVLESMELGKLGWLAELRFMIVGFINLGHFAYSEPNALLQTRDLITIVSKEVAKTGGVIWELVADSKGLVVMIAWGLVGSSHEDDRTRSLLSCMAILSALQARGKRAGIGIAAGRGFCGDRGNGIRREYALIGHTVNRAARLMSTAENEVLCDPEVAQADSTIHQTGLKLVSVGKKSFKGINEPLEVFRSEFRETPEQHRIDAKLIGRSAEKTVIDNQFNTPADSDGHGARFTILEGEPGVGKSTLLRYAQSAAEEVGLVSLHGMANSVERLVAYHPWREVMLDALELSSVPRAERQDAVAQKLGGIGELVDYAPLLNMIFSTSIAETEVTRDMQSEGRALKTSELLISILKSVDNLKVLFIEDGHWFDSSSMSLLKKISNEMPHLLVFLTTRPATGPLAEEYEEILRSPLTNRLLVGPMSESDTRQLILDFFNCNAVNPGLVRFIYERGNGNPFFTKELIQIISSKNYITTRNGFLSTKADINELKELIPTRVENVVSARMDQLETNDQLVLKIASVVNSEFPVNTLVDIDPLNRTLEEMSFSLNYLVEQDFLVHLEDASLYQFRHEIIERVAYDQLLYSQRRQLHASVASWFEENHKDSLESVLILLAHHYTRAEIPERALTYNDLAGTQALRNNANKEALQLLSTARELSDEATSLTESKEEKARRLEALSEVLFRLGKEEVSEETVRAALVILGRSTPSNPLACLVGLLRFACHQVSVRLINRQTRQSAEQTSWRLAYRLYDRYSRTAYLRMDVLTTLYATGAALYSAEKIGPSAELARAYASVCAASGIVPLHGVAKNYRRRAIATVESSDDIHAKADVHQLIALYACGIGDWKNCFENLAVACELFERIGDRTSYAICMQMIAANYLHQGRFTELARINEEMLADAERNDAWHEKIWSVNNLIQCQLMRNEDYPGLLELANLNYELAMENDDIPGNFAITISLIAVIQVRTKAFSPALTKANEALEIIENLTGSFFGALTAYRYAFEALLECWKHAMKQGAEARTETEEIESLVRRSYKQIRKFARVYPIAEPVELLAQGCILEMKGDAASALEKWRSSLQKAEKMELTYDAAQAHLYLSRLGSLADEEREHHGRKANELLESFALR